MSKFKVGDTVRWIRAAEWKLKDTVGTIKKIIPRSKDEDYIVQFAFGILRFSEKQIELAKRKGA
jgi:hypothetical protein